MGTWGQWEWAQGQSGNLGMKGIWGSQGHPGIMEMDGTWMLGMMLGTLQGPEDRGDMLRGHPGQGQPSSVG